MKTIQIDNAVFRKLLFPVKHKISGSLQGGLSIPLYILKRYSLPVVRWRFNLSIWFACCWLLLAAGCKKEIDNCEQYNYGFACFTNNKAVTITITVAGQTPFALAAGQNNCIEFLYVGNHQFSITQPTLPVPPVFSSFDVVQCGKTNVRIL